jgi:predicted  nucleic acid-binding Zn-ribbon protein
MPRECAICGRLYWDSSDIFQERIAYICPECYAAGYRVTVVYSNNAADDKGNERQS